jgi:hypothetical protein
MSLSTDEIKLKQAVKLLCSTGVRRPLQFERVKTWLNQFGAGPEQALGLLILRHLIYRTHDQIESTLAQALRHTAMHFVQDEQNRQKHHWHDILTGSTGLSFSFGPPRHDSTSPGKSGEVIIRLLKNKLKIPSRLISYPEVSQLGVNERFILVDDGTFTGEQLSNYINVFSSWFHTPGQTGIVVSIAHQKALDNLRNIYPHIPVFYGEKITELDGLEALSQAWIESGRWTYENVTPIEVYRDVAQNKAKFSAAPLGYASLGLMVAYEHGVPDDSLQLLWDESPTWMPLFDR